MHTPIVPQIAPAVKPPTTPVAEAYAIHQAACRHCRQGLRCSTAFDLAARAVRLEVGGE